MPRDGVLSPEAKSNAKKAQKAEQDLRAFETEQDNADIRLSELGTWNLFGNYTRMSPLEEKMLEDYQKGIKRQAYVDDWLRSTRILMSNEVIGLAAAKEAIRTAWDNRTLKEEFMIPYLNRKPVAVPDAYGCLRNLQTLLQVVDDPQRTALKQAMLEDYWTMVTKEHIDTVARITGWARADAVWFTFLYMKALETGLLTTSEYTYELYLRLAQAGYISYRLRYVGTLDQEYVPPYRPIAPKGKAQPTKTAPAEKTLLGEEPFDERESFPVGDPYIPGTTTTTYVDHIVDEGIKKLEEAKEKMLNSAWYATKVVGGGIAILLITKYLLFPPSVPTIEITESRKRRRD